MTKDEIIVKYTERILRQNNANDALTETRIIINDIKKLTYDSGGLISNNDRMYILNGIRGKITSIQVIKEAQESAMFTQSIDTVMEYLKPADKAIETEVTELSAKQDQKNN
jgi:hypothetical protein